MDKRDENYIHNLEIHNHENIEQMEGKKHHEHSSKSAMGDFVRVESEPVADVFFHVRVLFNAFECIGVVDI